VIEYAREGYLPEAMVNFLALLGWSPGSGDQELFTIDELAGMFDLSGISGGDAVFNQEKLDWFNQQHIFRLAPVELARRVRPWFEEAGIWSDALLGDRHAWFFAVLELLRPRAKKLSEFASLGRYFFSDQLEYDGSAVEKHLNVPGMTSHLEALDAAFAKLPTFDPASLEASLRLVADARSVKAATLIHAGRVAITGKSVSPGLFEVLSLVGRERTRARLAAAIRMISTIRG
jgi:glutamyl/glutaminyl-tRNA synthetase